MKLVTILPLSGFARHSSAPGIAPAGRRLLPGKAWAGRVLHLLLRMDDRGATAIEFLFIAPLLILLLLTIIDLGVMLTTQALLDGAARSAARLIQTGQVQVTGSPVTTFQTQLCYEMTPLISTSTCQSQIIFEVQNFASFSAVSFTPCAQNQGQPGSGVVCPFDAGTAEQIIGVQATYNYTFISPWVGACLTLGSCWFGVGSSSGSNPGTDTVPLVTTVIFMNEPFPSS
jgi:Flp pilus assembly protein TadG